MTTPQPGWYDDVDDANAQRYWDGQQWTPRRQRKPKGSVTARPTLPPAQLPRSAQATSPAQPTPAAQPPPSAQSTNGLLAKLRTNQLALHLIGGALGGAVGALLAELAPQDLAESRVESVVYTGLWLSISSAVIAASLFVCAEWYQRRELLANRVLKVLLYGAIAGFISGAVAQGVFLIHIGSPEFQNYALRSFCWGLAGAIIGGLLSRTVPNLKLSRGSAAGFVGGCIGGILFVLVSNEMPETWGRVIGIGALGLALGLAMYLVENLFREASLEVIWAYNETTRVSLGAQPISIGGDVEDHIFQRGLPPHAATVMMQNGQIEHIDNANGARTTLTDGSHLTIGSLQLIVHASQ
jgi:pimeloyl-ACP methyl ester carboxylesterase